MNGSEPAEPHHATHAADAEKETHAEKDCNQGCFLDRLRHFTWANYTFPMATGGLALLLSEQTQPYHFTGLQTIGKIVYIFDLVIVAAVTAAITYRFVRWKGTLMASIVHPTEGLFCGTALLSLASVIGGIGRYGVPACGPWLVVVYRVLFWIYFVVTFLFAVAQYYLLFTSAQLKIEDMTPAWDLPIFPVMLSGTIATVGASFQPPDQAVPMIAGGLMAQGLGFMVSMMMYSSYVLRMIQYGFPSPNSRAGMFIAVGPPSFTSLALIGLANGWPMSETDFGPAEMTAQILRSIATMASIFIWFVSLWFFCIATAACVAVRKQMTFRLSYWAFVFPNVGFTIAVISIGKSLQSPAVMWTGSAMTILLVAVWITVLVYYVRAIVIQSIWSHGKDEDVYVDETKHGHVKVGRLKADHSEEKQC